MGTGVNITARELLTLARSTASKLRGNASTATRRLNLCRQLLEKRDNLTAPLAEYAKALAGLNEDARYYWIGTFYSLLLHPADRRRQAAYFTPPHLADAIVSLLVKEGFDIQKHSVIDPAAGGAAFLSTVAKRMALDGMKPSQIHKKLHGIEIDTGLARLSEQLIAKRTGKAVPKEAIVATGDSLRKRVAQKFDLVIANPPYGRIGQTELEPTKWENVCYAGHINKYALFAELSCDLAADGGLVALLLPSSFMAGPLYDRLRAYLRKSGQLLVIGSVPTRNDVFADVAQDVSVLVLRKGTAHKTETPVVFGVFDAIGEFKATMAQKLPASTQAPWPTPAKAKGLSVGGFTLASYEASVKAGYFVWNREGERMHRRCRSPLYVPLVWAKNVKAGSFCKPRSRKGGRTDFVKFEADATTSIIRSNAIILQRTTNSAQKRRLIGARISPSVIEKWGGFITENHTLVVTATSLDTLNELCLLLNSNAVDQRYRQVSGTASVSVILLRNLDLPNPEVLRKCLREFSDPEKAIEAAYVKSVPAVAKASA